MALAVEYARKGSAANVVAGRDRAVSNRGPVGSAEVDVGEQFHCAGLLVDPAADQTAFVHRSGEVGEFLGIRNAADVRIVRHIGFEDQGGHLTEFAGLDGAGGDRLTHHFSIRVQEIDLVTRGIGAGRNGDVHHQRGGGQGHVHLDFNLLVRLSCRGSAQGKGGISQGEVTADLLTAEALQGNVLQGLRSLSGQRNLQEGCQRLESDFIARFGITGERNDLLFGDIHERGQGDRFRVLVDRDRIERLVRGSQGRAEFELGRGGRLGEGTGIGSVHIDDIALAPADLHALNRGLRQGRKGGFEDGSLVGECLLLGTANGEKRCRHSGYNRIFFHDVHLY